jgi:rare lipoprotein A
MNRFFYLFFFCVLLLNEGQAQSLKDFKESGVASYFTDKYEGRETVSGEKFYNDFMLGSHKKLPFNTMVKVLNTDNGKSVIVRIIDRGPYAEGRIIDVSKAAAQRLGLTEKGSAKVEITVVGENSKLYDDQMIISTKDPKKNTVTQSTGLMESKLLPGKTYDAEGIVKSPKGFGVQIGYFSKFENVLDGLDILEKEKIDKDFETHIIVTQENDKKFFRVIVGIFPDKTNAKINELITDLNSAGFKGAFPKAFTP